MSGIHLVHDYPHPPAKVWRAVTDPALVPLWAATGAGGRPVGFTTTVGTRFRFVAEPKPGWSGIVECEVLEVDEPRLLRYSWTGDDGGDLTEVTYRLEPHAGGTRFRYDHTGFTGVGGFFMARLLGTVRRRMLAVGLPAVLDDLDDDGRLRPPGQRSARSARSARSR
ncbi:SRPBCC domain-containing protein [Kitasatospora sp. NBC_01287]|uniref:SRPBCC family protein n=1 Tax=Kitasatospora sp. NBC_01287 TaxID=2903573 RepID=UPI002258142B|nr:SRPBCC domain-containing protein [Kitasatospora sp. NBC_01287]MCX4745810.1 SRPBCC domain-containing protein [Kitasatospora sp. NBC_01287]